MLRCQGLGKRYGRGGRWVLREVELALDAGDVLAVAGVNGAGKSTLLRLLVGLTRPTEGRVTGRPGRVGWVPDRFTAPERLTASSYLVHMGRMRGLSAVQARDRAGTLLERLALAGGDDVPLRDLSKGNAQKVSLAQALLDEPELLVLDEPWSGLDAIAHAVLAELIGEVAARGGAVAFTDHREAVRAAYAGRVCLIGADGRARPALSQGDPGPGIHGLGGAVGDAGQLCTLVVLRAPEGVAAEAGLEFRALPGVREVHPADPSGPSGWSRPSLSLRVVAGHSDALLLAALRRGWSVEAVSEELPVEGTNTYAHSPEVRAAEGEFGTDSGATRPRREAAFPAPAPRRAPR